MRKLILVLLALLVGVTFAQRAPLFMLEDVNGNNVRLGDYIGKFVVLLDFWATNCAPCVAGMPHVQQLYDKYKGQGLRVIGISEDLPRNLAAVRAKLRELGITYTNVLDRNASVLQAYAGGDTSIPLYVVIGYDGTITATFRRITAGDKHLIEEAIVAALAR